jgi:hypothetical protein
LALLEDQVLQYQQVLRPAEELVRNQPLSLRDDQVLRPERGLRSPERLPLVLKGPVVEEEDVPPALRSILFLLVVVLMLAQPARPLFPQTIA